MSWLRDRWPWLFVAVVVATAYVNVAVQSPVFVTGVLLFVSFGGLAWMVLTLLTTDVIASTHARENEKALLQHELTRTRLRIETAGARAIAGPPVRRQIEAPKSGVPR